MAVGLPEDAVEPYLKRVDNVIIGCVNSPKSVTVTGDEIHIDTLKSAFDKDKVSCRKIQVNIAYHSPHMTAVAADYLDLLGNLDGDCSNASSHMISTVTGKRISNFEVQKSSYWVDNMVSKVQFSAAMEEIYSAAGKGTGKKLRPNPAAIQVTDFLEVGPHSALQGPIKDILSTVSAASTTYCSALRRGVSALDTLLDAAGRLHCLGYPLNICEVNLIDQKSHGRYMALPDLPAYPFDHSREYWHESRLSKEGHRLRHSPGLDLLGSPVPDWNPLQTRWRKLFRVSEMPWIEDHRVRGQISNTKTVTDIIPRSTAQLCTQQQEC